MTIEPTSLALCFDAPMQSWGSYKSRNVHRDTAAEPTKSGVVGLLAAALGVPRDDDEGLAAVAALRLAVRVDREGIVERDYHTTQNVPTTTGNGHRTVVSERYYLTDGLFLVVLEGQRPLLERLKDALSEPRWPLFFGRKAFVPARPLVTEVGLVDLPADTVVDTHYWLEPSEPARAAELRKTDRLSLRAVTDCQVTTRESEARRDHPLSFAHGNRRHGDRFVALRAVPLTNSMIIEAGERYACT